MRTMKIRFKKKKTNNICFVYWITTTASLYTNVQQNILSHQNIPIAKLFKTVKPLLPNSLPPGGKKKKTIEKEQLFFLEAQH